MDQIAKMEELLNKLDKERNPVKKNLHNIVKMVDLNSNYSDDIVSIQEIRYQQIFRNNGIY